MDGWIRSRIRNGLGWIWMDGLALGLGLGWIWMFFFLDGEKVVSLMVKNWRQSHATSW